MQTGLTLQQILGTAAMVGGFAVCIGPVMQTLTIVRHRSARDVSLINFSLVLIASGLWAVYGLTIGDYFVALPNALDGILTVAVIGSGLWFRRRRYRSAQPDQGVSCPNCAAGRDPA